MMILVFALLTVCSAHVVYALPAPGVKVYVLMYQEVAGTYALDSEYQKRVLTSLHPNVHCMRHGSWFWTHHEKIVCIDRCAPYAATPSWLAHVP